MNKRLLFFSRAKNHSSFRGLHQITFRLNDPSPLDHGAVSEEARGPPAPRQEGVSLLSGAARDTEQGPLTLDRGGVFIFNFQSEPTHPT